MFKLKSIPTKLAPYFKSNVTIVIWFFFSAVLTIFTLHSILSITHPYSLDYGEAPLINQAMRLAAGENIYRPTLETPPFTIANYPPLYVLSLIPFLNIFESPFHMGRVISFASTLASAVFLSLTIFGLFKNRLAAITTGIFFLSFPYVVEWSVRARIDCLALAFATGALYIFVRWPRSRWGFFGGGILLIAAAAFFWLWRQDKKRAIQLAILVGGVGGMLFLLINTLTDGGFTYNIITANVNEFGWERLRNHLEGLWKNAGIILVMSAFFALAAWKYVKGWALLTPFLVGASLSALTIGKIGSNINYFLEITAALSLISGAMVFWSGKHAWRYTLVILLLSIQMGTLMKETMKVQVDWVLTSRRADYSALQRLEQVTLNMNGPIPADEYMGMLTMNGRRLYIQPFEVSQMANEGMWDQDPFLEDIANQEFEGILIHHFGTFPVHRERWTPEMLSAIEKYYRPTKTLAGTVVFIPQKATGISQVPDPVQKSSIDTTNIAIGSIQSISDVSNWSQPDIAVNPKNPEHVAVIATHTTKFECNLPNCKVELKAYISTDGGEAWSKITPLSGVKNVLYSGLVDFDSENNLYAFGIRDNALNINTTNLVDGYLMIPADFEEITRSQVAAKPWFRVHPETGQVYVTLDAQEEDMLFVTPSLLRSKQDGYPWTTTSRTDLRVSVNDFHSGRATWPDDIQILFGGGSNVSLIWTWGWEPWTWPRTVWMANSSDSGETFGEPTPILETWAPINSTSANGIYAIVYRTGTETSQQLAVATSSDQGSSWTSAIASGDMSLDFDVELGPGIGMAPDGTIDLIFRALDSTSISCVLNIQSWQEVGPWGRVDPCKYNIYYTYSEDVGVTFSKPIQLNDKVVDGESLARFENQTEVGSHLSVASTDEFAYPIWIGTPGPGKTQVYSVQIIR